MKFLATLITIICLLIVSAMGNNILYVCALMGCEIVAVSSIPDTPPKKCRPCTDYEEMCAAESCSPCEPAEVPDEPECDPLLGFLTQACNCLRSDPRLTAVLGDYRYKGPETSISEISSPGAVFKTVPCKYVLEIDRVSAIHPIIATTVLRL